MHSKLLNSPGYDAQPVTNTSFIETFKIWILILYAIIRRFDIRISHDPIYLDIKEILNLLFNLLILSVWKKYVHFKPLVHVK